MLRSEVVCSVAEDSGCSTVSVGKQFWHSERIWCLRNIWNYLPTDKCNISDDMNLLYAVYFYERIIKHISIIVDCLKSLCFCLWTQ
jgi:hypothetical protein